MVHNLGEANSHFLDCTVDVNCQRLSCAVFCLILPTKDIIHVEMLFFYFFISFLIILYFV